MENKTLESSYVLCIDNGGYLCSLEIRKIYITLPDAQAEKCEFIRVIDETGEDYCYPANLFVPIEVPSKATTILFKNA